VLGADGFYGVRAAAATSLGSVGTERAEAALLSALQQSDSRVRTAVFGALLSVRDVLTNHNANLLINVADAMGIIVDR
jgi:HEAT repeat protein